MRCSQCPAEIAPGGHFCPRCGTPVSQPAQYQPGQATGYSQQPVPQQRVPGAPVASPTPLADNASLAGGWPAQPATGQMPADLGYGDPAGWAAGPSAPAGYGHAAASRSGGTPSWIIGGVLALIGAAVILAACFLPYAHFVACTGCKATSPSLIKPGTGQSSELWYAVEPIGVLVLAVVCSILLFAVRVRLAAVVASGMLLAFGIQTVLLFAGYQFSFSGTTTHHGTAGGVGMLGGLLLIVAALFGLAANSGLGRAAPG